MFSRSLPSDAVSPRVDPKSKPHIVFVCDFNKIHSRIFVQFFSRQTGKYRVTVISTRHFIGPSDATVVNLHHERTTGRSGLPRRVFERLYPFVVRVPGAFNFIWRLAIIADVRHDSASLPEAVGDDLQPDIIHAFRTQPEGIVALQLKRRFPRAKLCLTTWGQDFLIFGRGNATLRRMTREVVEAVDLLLPDNARDGAIAVEEYGLRPQATMHVMPAPGGLDLDAMRRFSLPRAELPALRGTPSLLTSRGHESGYNKLFAVIRAFKLVVATHPDAHMYIAVEPGEARIRDLRRRIESMGLGADRATVFVPDRRSLMAHMQICDLNVFASATDGLAMTLLEAMYFGQVLVVANHSCYTPPLTDGENCVMFEKITPVAIAHAIRGAISLSGDRVQRVAYNRQLIEESFDRDRNLMKIQQWYDWTLVASVLATGTEIAE
ncbi:MAG: glycosyltransferase family 4 protein [Gemmatimonadaceae bacterium]